MNMSYTIQTLIHHNFFGDPVELEPVDDFHLLGFNIDLQQRTITYMQPSQPWKIRDSTTAGSQRLALSGLQSRLHTIRKYTFPPSSAEAAAAELVRLYVQKGHNHHACHRFLKKRRSRRLVCVHPWTKGFVQPIHLPLVPPPIHKQGRQARYTYLTQRSSGVSRDGWTDHPPVPAEFSTRCHPTLPRFDSWFFMFPPLNRFLSHFQQPRSFAACRRSQGKQPLFKHLQFSRTFRHAVPPPSFSTWELSH